MRPAAILESACRLSYDVARNGSEADPELAPPDPMVPFLAADETSDEALAAARSAIDEDPAFRRRVAEQADESDVGRAGYLWLHRPIGWASEFEDLAAASMGEGDNGSGPWPSTDNGHQALVDAVDAEPDLGDDDHGGEPVESVPAVLADPDADYAVPGPAADADEPADEANAFESELSSLRGLVDRLANERKAVATSAERVEQQVNSSRQQPSVFDSDVYTLQSELDAARSELERARQERDSAVASHSSALTRQLELEKQLEASRERQLDIERGHEAVDTELVSTKEQLARVEASVEPLRAECSDLGGQIDSLKAANLELTERVEQLDEERTVAARTAEVRIHELEADTDQLTRDLESSRTGHEEVKSELEELRGRFKAVSAQAEDSTALVDMLTEEKMDVASRLADTESMLETTRTQLANVRTDAEALAADLSNVKAHRDGLATQVDELHSSLGEALDNLARVRSTSDADRAALKEVRTERDQLKVRVSSLEQAASTFDAKLASVSSERDEANRKHDEQVAAKVELERRGREFEDERAVLSADIERLERVVTEAEQARDGLQGDLDTMRREMTEVEGARSALQQQVEQLTGESKAIQDQLVEADRLRVETSESQGRALAELAQRLSVTETERARLESELADTSNRLGRAESALAEAEVEVAAARSRAGARAEADDRAEGIESTVGVHAAAGLRDTVKVEAKTASADSDPDSDEAEEGPTVAGLSGVLAGRDEAETVLDAAADDAAEIAAEVPEGVDAVADADDPAALIGRAVDDRMLDDGEGDEDEDGSRNTGRYNWSLGGLRRGAKGRRDDDGTDDELPPPPPPAGSVEPDSLEGVDALGDDLDAVSGEVGDVLDAIDENDFDAIAAAVSEANEGLGADDEPAEPSGDDLDAVSAGLAEALGRNPEPARNADDDELDAISDLISQTVSDMKLAEQGDEDESAEGAWTDGPDGHGVGKPPSIFSEVEGPTSDEYESTGSRRTIPPSVLNMPDDGPASGRRQIEVPDEIMDDEVELARHIVSSPDVVLLVDGDSVAKMGWPSLPVAQQRDALVSYLADLSASSGVAPDIVFDGRVGEEEALPASRAVRIRLSTPPTEPAAALDELIDAYPLQWPIAVVTDDDALAASASERGASVLNNGQLLDLFIAQ